MQWLYAQVADPNKKRRSLTYWVLFRQLFTTEFMWFVLNDDNRWVDGKDLRYEFLVETDTPYVYEDFMDVGCCMLEMLIALSRRIAFLTDTPVDAWFWHILNNIGIAKFNDACEDFEPQVQEALERVIWRTYDFSGRGGLFPLRAATKDQTKIEIWYQMGAYILENS